MANKVNKHPNGMWESSTLYDNAEFSLATDTSDYDVSSGQANAFTNVAEAKYLSIITDNTITIKLNSTDSNSITITSSEVPWTLKHDETGIVITNVYISNASGSTAAIKLFLA